MKKTLHISLDLGKVLFDNGAQRIPFGKNTVCRITSAALPVLYKWSHLGYRLSVISKIDPECEARVTMSLVYAGIVPHIIDPAEVRFCYERSHKGAIAAKTTPDIHIDDRVEPMNSIHRAGVRWKIFFIEFHDDRVNTGPLCFGPDQGLFIARNWEDIERIVSSLPS